MITYYVLRVDPADGSETVRPYAATTLSEALMMAERDDAGSVTYLYGVRFADFAIARAEGIRFNEADGLLTD